MANKALNLRMEESELFEMKEVAEVYNISVTDLVKNAVKEYIGELKNDPYYRLTANVKEASAEESEEILREIESMSDDDLTIASVKRFKL